MSLQASEITQCPECGSAYLTWQTSNVVLNGIQQGRLKTEDVQCVFVLGCDVCSETLAMVKASEVAELMNAQFEAEVTTPES